MRTSFISKIIIGFGVLIIALDLIFVFDASAANWGADHFAFYSTPVVYFFILLLLLILIPSVHRKLEYYISKLIELFALGSFWKILVTSVGMILAILLFWVFRERTFLLGDGAGILRYLRSIQTTTDIATLFRHEPFAGFMMWRVYSILNHCSIQDSAVLAVQIVSIVSGVATIPVLGSICNKFIIKSPIEKINEVKLRAFLLFSLIISAGTVQLFFGYVELYAPAYFVFTLYVWSAVDYLQGKRGIVYPAAIFGGLLSVKFGMVALCPSLLYLAFHDLRKKGIKPLILAGVVSLSTWCLLLAISGYTFSSLVKIFANSDSHILPILSFSRETSTPSYYAYSVLSVTHLQELGNLFWIMSPYLLLLLPLILIARRSIRTIFRLRPEYLFVFITALGALCIILLFNPDAGMSRDWDVMATMSLPIIFFAGLLWIELLAPRYSPLLVVIIVFSVVHTVAWIGINANQEKALTRFQTLPNPERMGKWTIVAALEELGNYVTDHPERHDLLQACETIVRLDSTNVGLYTTIGDVYSRLGSHDSDAIVSYEKAVRLGDRHGRIYRALAYNYFYKGRIDESIDLLKRAYEINPYQQITCYNLGAILCDNRCEYTEAVQYFKHALREEGNSALLINYIIKCYLSSGQVDSARIYLAMMQNGDVESSPIPTQEEDSVQYHAHHH